MKHFFITGATGTIGSALVRELLDEPDLEVWLLIRAKADDDLRQRLNALLQFWNIAPEDPLASRIHALRGDAAVPRFGLPDNEYAELTRRTTHIVHSAAVVRMNLPLEEARQSASGSIKQIVELAQRCQSNGVLSKVDVVSTVGVGGRSAYPLPEQPVPEVTEFHNTYEQSKAEAEKIAFAHARELPITVHRPSMVVGHSRTGKIIHFQVFYHLCEFLCGRYTYGVVPRLGAARLDTIPVDYVARAIKWSSLNNSNGGGILHLCSAENSIVLDTLARKVHTYMKQNTSGRLAAHRQVPLSLFRGAIPVVSLLAGAKARRALATLPIFLDYLKTPQLFTHSRSKPMLAAQGIEFSPPDVYLDNVLSYYCQSKYGR